ncbi:hypothetical protein [Hymenobacter negativus]|uniref:4Fe-4S ferredoxin-type domain-containing protein n=1 Tax=Hymenobacter negativus TaxID=2795026 RepID=A0ABS3QNP2_9BACT|nr:hypothetical protein [Hymenobacter negativus]MBO2012899.1 hypothetical protein [Hymenobacter negativus]
MQRAIEQQYTHCRQRNCVQVCPTGSSHYEDPTNGCVRWAVEAYDEERHFTVHAEERRSVTLIAIDKCLIGQGANKPKRCDCAFYTNDKIAFVEFKLRPPDREREEDTRQTKRLEEAAEQLIASIKSFEADGFITTQGVEAYAHVGFQPIIPAPTTTLQNLSALINAETRSLVDFYASNEVTL